MYPSAIPGGFIALDIFFVMSGYLITGLIVTSINQNEFSFIEFYRRRLLRILPVLNAAVIASVVVGQIVLLPQDYIALLESALASTLSLVNIYFYHSLDISYFSQDSSYVPLLHLWSMGIEEQFYFAWPLLVFGLIKLKAYWLLIVSTVLIFVSSIYAGQIVIAEDPMAGYYLLQYRISALSAGAIAAYFTLKKGKLGDNVSSIFAWLTLSVIVLSLITTSKTSYPGYAAFFPLVSIALLLVSSENRQLVVSKLLSNKVAVFLGSISYSTYVWHWPILSFYRYLYGPELAYLEASLLFIAIVFTGVLSYYFIETPIRKSQQTFNQAFTKCFLLPVIFIGILLYLVVITHGKGLYIIGNSYEKALNQLKTDDRNTTEIQYICQYSRVDAINTKEDRCIINGTKEPKTLLWGDSNAAHFVGLVGEISAKEGFSFRNISHSGCAPILFSIKESSLEYKEEDCLYSIEEISKVLNKYQTVIVAAGWSLYFEINPNFKFALEKSLKYLTNSGKKVLLVGQIPFFNNFDKDCKYKSLKVGWLNCQVRNSQNDFEDNKYNLTLREVAHDIDGVEYFDVNNFLCSNGVCSPYIKSSLVYYDERHLSHSGSWLIGKLFVNTSNSPQTLKEIKEPSHINTEYSKDLEVWLKNRVRKRFLPVEARGKSLLGEYKSANVTSDGSLVFTDSSKVKYEYIQQKLSSVESLVGKNMVSLMIDFSLAGDNNPLIRIDAITREEVKKFDMLFVKSREFLKRKGGAKLDYIFLDKLPNKRYKAFMSVPIHDVDEIKVTVFPAASINGVKYSKLDVGTIFVKEIKVLIE